MFTTPCPGDRISTMRTSYLAVLCCTAVVVVFVIYLNSSQSRHGLNQGEIHVVLTSKVELNKINSELLKLSEHPDIDTRGKFQKTQIQKLCKTHFSTNKQSYPNTEDSSITELHGHIIFEDKQKILYCYVPKVGSSNMRRLFMYMSDSIPMYTVDWPRLDYNKFYMPAMKKASFLNVTLKQSEKKARITNYYKFMIIRNPLERVVSAYRDKLEPPLNSSLEDNFARKMKLAILSRYCPVELRAWQQSDKAHPTNISVTFQEYCRYLGERGLSGINEHFAPSMDLCQPCLMHYDFYGNFRNYSTDSAQLIKKFNTDPKFYRDESLHTPHDQTRRKLHKYYQTLSQQERVKLFGRLFDELLFYYTLYPSERNSHKEILGIDTPVLSW